MGREPAKKKNDYIHSDNIDEVLQFNRNFSPVIKTLSERRRAFPTYRGRYIISLYFMKVKKILTVFLIFFILTMPFFSFAQDLSNSENIENPSSETSEENLNETQLKSEDNFEENLEENREENSEENIEKDSDKSAISTTKPETVKNEESSENIKEKSIEAEDEEISDMERDLSLPGMSLKASQNEKVSYTAKRVGKAAGETTVFKVTSSDGNKYSGACNQQGVSMKSSGTATVTRVANTTKLAKIIYYYCVQLGSSNWWTSTHKTDKVGSIINVSGTNVTKRRMVEAFCQIYNMGSGTGSGSWYKVITASSTGGWSTTTAEGVRQYYLGISDKAWYKNLTVPDDFELWYASSDAQHFNMWATIDSTDANVYVKKVSGNAATTGNPNYSLAGAVYKIYTDSSCSTTLKEDDGTDITLITEADGETDIVSVDPDKDYWVKEVSHSTGFNLDPNVYQIHPTTANDEDHPYVVNSTEPPQDVNITILKSVTNPNVVAGNALYSVAGTTFKLYNTQTDAINDTNAVAAFSINANGISGTATVLKGDYYLVETAAGPGLIIPNVLKASNGGRALSLTSSATITIP